MLGDAVLSHWQSVIDSLPFTVALVNQKGIIVGVNAEWRRFGEANGLQCECVGRPYIDETAPPEELAGMPEALNAILQGTRENFALVYPCHSPDGRERLWFRVEVRPWRTASMLMGAMILHTNVTETELLREKSWEDAERYRLLVDQAPVGFFIMSRDGRFLQVNREYGHMLACGLDAVMDKSWVEWAVQADRAKCLEAIRDVYDSDGHHPFLERRLAIHGGKEITTDCRLALLRRRNGKAWLVAGVEYDTTNQRMQEALKARASKLESLGLLAGGIAHDINNIMMSVSLALDLAHPKCGGDPSLKSLLEDAGISLAQAANLSRRLLTLSQDHLGERKLLHLRDVLPQRFEALLRDTAIAGQCSVHPGTPPILADEGQLLQVLDQLVINAREASPPGGTIRLGVEGVSLNAGNPPGLPEGWYARIEVQDFGVGIPQDVLPRIMDPYFSTKAQGRGLGMATANAIARAHQGEIMVRSVAGQGTICDVFLPARGEVPDKAPVMPPAHAGRRVLVIDDDARISRMLSLCLTRDGYDVMVSGDGEEGVAKYRQAIEEGRPVSAVILDATIPNGRGGEWALNALRAVDPNVKAILFSGHTENHLFQRWRNAGFAGALRKPCSLENIRQALVLLCSTPG
jgi:PAS domain S-box-containing protein